MQQYNGPDYVYQMVRNQYNGPDYVYQMVRNQIQAN